MIAACLIIVFVDVILLCAGPYMLWKIPFCTERSAQNLHKILSIIIPARNEERNLPALLGSIQNQTVKPREVIVVDDSSTDATRQTALDFGSRVIEAGALPDGWTGKSWACRLGARAARGDILLFLDADTRLEQHGLEKILGAFGRCSGVVSMCPYHTTKRGYEDFSVFFNIMMAAGINAFTPRGNKEKNKGLFGQCMILSKQHYEKAGGHESVRAQILENFFLSNNFRTAAIAIACYGGKGTISMRMFPGGLSELIQGWSKAFASGAGNTAPGILCASIMWISAGFVSFILPLCCLHTGMPSWLCVLSLSLYAAYAAQVAWMMRRVGSFGLKCALLYPIYLIFYNAVFLKSLTSLVFRQTVTWKGRNIGDHS